MACSSVGLKSRTWLVRLSAHTCHYVTQLLEGCCCFDAVVWGFLTAVLTVLKVRHWPVPIWGAG